ncbi:MAG TPA: ABC transporter ATP-binding protein [Cellulomonas sp.]
MTAPGSTALAAGGLVKTFGTRRALDGLDLHVATGEVHGFLGPNGAGKSTTLRVLLGLLRRDAGEVEVLGGDPWRDAVRLHRHLAYVPGEADLWPNLSGGEAIDLLGRLRGGLDPARRTELVDRFELDPTVRVRAYSKGNRQKVALVAALAADVRLLVLDEPTSGLDPLMEAVFQQCIREAAAGGCTVLLSSHILAEVEALCERVTIIRGGRAVRSGTLDDLRGLTRTTVVVRLRDEEATTAAEAALRAVDGVHEAHREDGHLRLDVDGPALDQVLALLPAYGVRALTAHPPTLEDLFLREYGSAAGAR